MKRFLATQLLLIGLILIVAIERTAAQDQEFSQYYAAPLYFESCLRGDHCRSSLYCELPQSVAQHCKRAYVSYAFSYDYNLYNYNSGIGFLATVDQAGTAGMKSTQLNFLYSYKINIAKKWVISSGLNFGYAVRSIDFNKLLLVTNSSLMPLEKYPLMTLLFLI